MKNLILFKKYNIKPKQFNFSHQILIFDVLSKRILSKE